MRVLRIASIWIILSFGASTRAENPAAGALEEFSAWLEGRELSDEALRSLRSQPFAAVALSKADADTVSGKLWAARREFLRKDRQAEFDARELVQGELTMPFWFTVFGDEPTHGRSLFISMHGGGGAPPHVNDQQYENQKRLYKPTEGVYLVPRAATNTWNLWHQEHIDQFFDRLITDMLVFENVDPDRVCLMGYSAGGDGVYQLAPRMADRLAAAAMMAGHPNESRPEGLRNIGFTIHVGAEDAAYNRNRVAAEWGQRLAALQAADPDGYTHEVTVHEGLGHWMNLKDAVAIPWMAKFRRNAWPSKVVWVQDDVRHPRFYWLRSDQAAAKAGDEIVARVDGQAIRIEKCAAERLTLLLCDRLVDLNQPVTIIQPSGASSRHSPVRRISTVAECLLERNDPQGLATAELELQIPKQ